MSLLVFRALLVGAALAAFTVASHAPLAASCASLQAPCVTLRCNGSRCVAFPIKDGRPCYANGPGVCSAGKCEVYQ